MRRRELGVRAALGASPRQIYALVMSHGMRVTAVGLGAGLAASLIAARLLETLLFETRSRDPLAYVVTIAAIAITAWAACALPARRATRIDPLTALKAE